MATMHLGRTVLMLDRKEVIEALVQYAIRHDIAVELPKGDEWACFDMGDLGAVVMNIPTPKPETA